MSSILQHPSLALGEENISHADPRGFLCTPFDTSVQSVSMHCPLQRLLVRKWPARFLYFLSTSFLICGCSRPPPPLFSLNFLRINMLSLIIFHRFSFSSVSLFPSYAAHTDAAVLASKLRLLPSVLPILQAIPVSPLQLATAIIEAPLRSILCAAQVRAGMWVRNGYVMLNLMINYRSLASSVV